MSNLTTGYKHSTRWSFGDILYHKMAKSRGMVVGVQLRPNSPAQYFMVFEDERIEELCSEFELTEAIPTVEGETKL